VRHGVRRLLLLLGDAPMSDSESQRRRDLECMRLASDFMQLASGTLNRDLKAHCYRSAKIWSDQAEHSPLSDAVQNASAH
jgi:hypothetical protein